MSSNSHYHKAHYPHQVDVNVFALTGNPGDIQRVIDENPGARVTFDPNGTMWGQLNHEPGYENHPDHAFGVVYSAFQQDGYVVTVEKTRAIPQGD